MGQEPIHAIVPEHVPENLVFDFDIYADERLTEDLHDSYEKLHELAPDIFYTPRNGGHWVFTRYDDIEHVMRDYQHFSVREMQIPRVENPPRFIPLSLDPPENIPYRKALTPVFAPKNIARMEPKVREFCVGMIEEVVASGKCDFVNDISSRFPVSVYMDLMGMPMDKLREFRTLADRFFNGRTDEELMAVTMEVFGIFTELIMARQQNPGDDLISKIMEFEIDGRPVTVEEMQHICYILFLGGMDTVTNVSSFAFRHLATDPTLQTRLREEPEIIPNFIDEALRCFGVINDPRIVTQDHEQFGIQFKEGEMVIGLLPLAGRDDRKNDNPNAFDVDRKEFHHLTFSAGPHVCLGQYLAKMEIGILIEEWLKRIPQFRRTPGVRHESRYGMVMSLENLPLEWDV